MLPVPAMQPPAAADFLVKSRVTSCVDSRTGSPIVSAEVQSCVYGCVGVCVCAWMGWSVDVCVCVGVVCTYAVSIDA